MTQPASDAGPGGQGEQVQPQETQQIQQPENQAPYAQYLERVPESARPMVEPIFKEWDANYTRTTQDYAEKLRRYEPYNQIIDAVGDPQALAMAVQTAYELQQDPETMFQRLAEYLNYELDDEEEEAGQGGGGNEVDPRIDSMEQGLSQLTEMLQNQQEEQELNAQTSEIFDALDDAEAERGMEMDRELVLTRAIETDDLEGAIEWYYQKFGPLLQQQSQQQGPPTPLGGGGGLPSNQTKPLSEMTPQERKQFVIGTLNAANQQAQQ